MLVSGLGQKTDVGRQRDIARHFLPHELKRVRRKPHVFAAARDRVGLSLRVVIDGAWMKHGPNIPVILEHANGRRLRIRLDQREHHQQKRATGPAARAKASHAQVSHSEQKSAHRSPHEKLLSQFGQHCKSNYLHPRKRCHAERSERKAKPPSRAVEASLPPVHCRRENFPHPPQLLIKHWA